MSVCVCVCVCVCARARARACVCMCECAFTRARARAHVCVCVCMSEGNAYSFVCTCPFVVKASGHFCRDTVVVALQIKAHHNVCAMTRLLGGIRGISKGSNRILGISKGSNRTSSRTSYHCCFGSGNKCPASSSSGCCSSGNGWVVVKVVPRGTAEVILLVVNALIAVSVAEKKQNRVTTAAGRVVVSAVA